MLLLGLAAAHILSKQAGTVSVPFHLGNDSILVDCTVNGRALTLLFDSGFGGSVLADENINLGPSDGTANLRDFVGQLQAKTVKIQSLKIGAVSVDLSDPELIQQPFAQFSPAYNAHSDGLLGFQAVENYVTEINFQNKQFVLHPKSFDISQRAPDNKKTFLVKMLPLGVNAVELPVLSPSGKRMILALDTGNSYFATTHTDVLERVGLWSDGARPAYPSQNMVASGPVSSWEKELSGLTIFGVPVPTSYWDVLDLPSSDAEGDGTVGIEFLKNFNITIDYDRRLVWLENFTGEVGNDPPGETGIYAMADRERGDVEVVYVTPGSPADKLGIKRGDLLLEINGVEVSQTLTFREAKERLDGQVGTKVSVAVSHGGQLERYDIERTALFNP